jgi:hypothetical protein
VDCSSVPLGPCYPKLPPLRHTRTLPDQAPKVCQASDPQTFTISAGPHPLGPAQPCKFLLCWAMPLRPAKLANHTCTISARPRSQACTICSASLCPPSLPSQQSTHIHDLHQPCTSGLHRTDCTISARPPGCTPHTCTGLHDLHWDCAPKICQAGNPQTPRSSTLPGLHPLGMQGPCSKGPLVCLNRESLCPKTHGTPPTCHPPQKGSKPAKETHTNRSGC